MDDVHGGALDIGHCISVVGVAVKVFVNIDINTDPVAVLVTVVVCVSREWTWLRGREIAGGRLGECEGEIEWWL